MYGIDDADRLRFDDADGREDWGRRPEPADDTFPTFLAVTKTLSAYPTASGTFVAIDFKGLTGVEGEGNAGVSTALGKPAGQQQYAYIPAGATVPASGSEVIVKRVRHRWVLCI